MVEEVTIFIQTIAAACIIYVFFKVLKETDRFNLLTPRNASLLIAGSYYLFMICIAAFNNVYLPMRVMQLITHTLTIDAIESILLLQHYETITVFAAILGLYSYNSMLITNLLFIDSVFQVMRSISTAKGYQWVNNVEKMLLYSYVSVYMPLYYNFDVVTLLCLLLVNVCFNLPINAFIVDRSTPKAIAEPIPTAPSPPPHEEPMLINLDIIQPLPTIPEEEKEFIPPPLKTLTLDEALPPLVEQPLPYADSDFDIFNNTTTTTT